ncbi:hypothetical protein TWF281_006851 [Arthrobotrys megalospora]
MEMPRHNEHRELEPPADLAGMSKAKENSRDIDCPAYAMDDLTTAKLKEIQDKYLALLSTHRDPNESYEYTFIENISIVSCSPSLLASKIRQLRKLPLGARVLLLSDFLQNADKWKVPLHWSRELNPAPYRQIEELRLTNMVRSLISLVPNVDDMHGDGDRTRIKDIFTPKGGRFSGGLFGGVFDIVFEWIISGSSSFLEFGISIPYILKALVYWERRASIGLIIDHLGNISKDDKLKGMDVDLDTLKAMALSGFEELGEGDFHFWIGSSFKVPETPT